ncbi:hypothetical protein [Streptosporangium sp. NPDC023615]|uniref:hypothetical protein n=1 Tax=Streptosporangium sp. NPDC023615 TaxID=3154794 RepID=UPI0034131374
MRVIRGRLMSQVPLVAAACLLSLTACAAEQEPPLDTSLRLDRRPLVLPVDAYQISPEDRGVVVQAQTELFRGCMARLGFTVPPRNLEKRAPVVVDHERYLLEDEQAARTRGYHLSEALRAGTRQTPGKPEGPLNTRYLAAANGAGRTGGDGNVPAPPGGCEREAHDKLIPASATDAMRRVDDLRSRSWERSLRDSRVTAVFAAWSSCMARLGHDYPTPRAANNDAAFRTDEPTPREIATAVADVRCKRQTKVVPIWAAVEAAYQKQAIAERRTELREARNTLAALVTAARTIVRGR